MIEIRPTLLVRLVLALAGVAAFSTAVALVFHDRTLSRELEGAARKRVEVAAAAAGRLAENHLDVLQERYRAISGTPQFRANLGVEDPPTLNHYADELLRLQGAARILFLDGNGRTAAAAGDAALDDRAIAVRGRSLITKGGRPWSVVAIPLETGGLSLGRLVAVEPLPARTIADWSDLCGAQVRFGDGDPEVATLDAVSRRFGGLIMRVELSLAPEREALARSRWNLLTAGIVAVLAALIVSLFFSRGLIRPILQIKAAAARIGQGDFNVRIRSDRRDEIGDVARAFEGMAASLRSMLGHVAGAADGVEATSSEIASASRTVAAVTADQVRGIQQTAAAMEEINARVSGVAATAATSARALNVSVEGSTSSFREMARTGDELNHNAAALNAQVDEVSASIEQMLRSAQRVSAGADELARAAEQTSTSMEEMARSTQRADRNAEEGAHLSTRVLETAEKGRARVMETIQGMEVIRVATETAEGVIRGLAARVKEIGTIVKVIDDVSDETNLLALNAEIISAQAGEHGRAFSVVAGQMKNLSNRVLAGTKEIRGLIEAVRAESGNAIGAIEHGSRSVGSGVELAAEAGESLEEITGATRESGTRMLEISSAMSEQSEAVSRVVRLMQNVLSGVEQIRKAGREQKASNEAVLRGSSAMREVAQQVSGATGQQARSAARIGENIETVRRAVEEINHILQEQSAACHEAAGVLDSVSERTGSNEEAARRLEEVMRELLSQAETLRQEVRRFRIGAPSEEPGSPLVVL